MTGRHFLSQVTIAARFSWATLVAIGAVIGLVTDASITYFVITLLAVTCISLVWVLWNTVRRQSVRREEDFSTNAVQAIVDTVPEGRFLVDFLSTTIFSGRTILELRSIDKCHHLRKYRKDFRLVGCDIYTTEIYDGVNTEPTTASAGIRMVSFGGSSVHTDEVQQTVTQYINGKPYQVFTSNLSENERLKEFFTNFVSPVLPGNPFFLRYDEFWPRAMAAHFDAVFYTQTLYFEKGVSLLSSRIEFDSIVDNIGAYWYDLGARVCRPHTEQPRPVTSTERPFNPIYEWNCHNPDPNRLYFITFRRR